MCLALQYRVHPYPHQIKTGLLPMDAAIYGQCGTDHYQRTFFKGRIYGQRRYPIVAENIEQRRIVVGRRKKVLVRAGIVLTLRPALTRTEGCAQQEQVNENQSIHVLIVKIQSGRSLIVIKKK